MVSINVRFQIASVVLELSSNKQLNPEESAKYGENQVSLGYENPV